MKTKLHLIALNQPLKGDIGGIDKANGLCQAQASHLGLKTTFRALLTTTKQRIGDLVVPADHHSLVVNLRGQAVMSSFMDLLKNKPAFNVPLYSFANKTDVMNDHSTW